MDNCIYFINILRLVLKKKKAHEKDPNLFSLKEIYDWEENKESENNAEESEPKPRRPNKYFINGRAYIDENESNVFILIILVYVQSKEKYLSLSQEWRFYQMECRR
jgi:hypothetical protein